MLSASWLGAVLINSAHALLHRGLAHIHKAGIAHRDMKPDNLLLNADGCLKVSGFGLLL
jgi:serine/threonine protein kinase